MKKKEYPLEPLARVRDRKVDDAARALAEAARAREEAVRARLEAEKRRDEAEARARAVQGTEREALENGVLRAGDLARADAWGARAAVEHVELAKSAVEAAVREHTARVGESGARDEVSTRKRDAEVVERDRAKWTERERKIGEAKEEEAADEAWRKKP